MKSLYTTDDPSSVRGFGALKIASSHGQRKEATESLGLSALTTALCHTLLYLPLLKAYIKANSTSLVSLIF